jgi:hypothetical protein
LIVLFLQLLWMEFYIKAKLEKILEHKQKPQLAKKYKKAGKAKEKQKASTGQKLKKSLTGQKI